MPRTQWQELSFDELLSLSAKKQYGAILHYFRLKTRWTARQLADLYSEALHGEGDEDETKTITDNWVYMMERRNMVPRNKKRRWILARLLDIPPALFGLEPPRSQSLIPTWEDVDADEYQLTLEAYCTSYHQEHPILLLHDIKRRIHALENEICYARGPEKRCLQNLLSAYLILAATLLREKQEFIKASELLGRAIIHAKQAKAYDLRGLALRQRGIVSLSEGDILSRSDGFIAAQPSFKKASIDLEAALQSESFLSPSCIGVISLTAGAVYARVCQDRQELRSALKVMDKGSKHIGKGTNNILITAPLDEEGYHLDMADAYLAPPIARLRSPERAREELEYIPLSDSKTRQARNLFFLAKSYLIEGNYPMVTACAEAVIEQVQGVLSSKHMARLDYLYQELRKSSYGNHPDVARLGVELLKLQQPELFT